MIYEKIQSGANSLGLRGRMLVFFGALLIVMLLLIQAINLYGLPIVGLTGSYRDREADAFVSLSSFADLKKAELLAWIDERRANMRVFAEAAEFRRAAPGFAARARGLLHKNGVGVEIGDTPTQRFVEMIANSHSENVFALIADGSSGTAVYASRKELIGARLAEGSAYSVIAAGVEEVVQIAPQKEEPGSVMLFSRAIYPEGGEGNLPAGVLMVAVDIGKIVGPMLNSGSLLGRTGEVVLVNQAGRPLAAMKHTNAEEHHAGVMHVGREPALFAAQGIEGVMTAVDYRGEPVLAATRHVRISSELGIGMIVKIDEAEIFKSLRRTNAEYIVVAAAGVCLGLALVSLISGRLTAPLHELSSTVKRIGAGDLEARVRLAGGDEISALGSVFNRMADRIQNWHQELNDQVRTRTAELNAEMDERNRTERELRESEARFRAVFENSLDAIGVSCGGMHRFANRAYRALFGLPRDSELKGVPVLDLIAPECRENIRENIRRRAHGEEVPSRYETRGLRADGSEFEMEVNVSVYRETNEDYTVVILRDITARKRAEDVLRESRERLNTILNSTAEGIYGVDQDGNCTFWNAAAGDMLGYDEQHLLGKLVHDIIHHTREGGAPYPWAECLVRDSLGSGEKVHSARELLWRADGKPLVVEYWAHPMRFNGIVQGAVVTFIDISERTSLESQLRQAQKMEAVGQLAGGVAHDFNNILSALIGYATLARMKMDEDDPNRHNIDQILTSCDRAAVLTQSLLAFSRKQVVNLAKIDLNDVVVKFERFLLRLIREDIELLTTPAPGPLAVLADRGQIEQVLMNLVTNARDAMPRGGKILIETKAEVVEHPQGDGRAPQATTYAVVSVTDTGTGMTEEVQQKIFDPFFTTKEEGKGTGLGLAMVYGIVRQHQGNITVVTQPGQGTTIRISLPLLRNAHVEAVAEESAAPIRGGNETILLAEDDAALRRLGVIVLSHYGYRVIEAVDGKDAIAQFREHRDSIRLVVLDGIMPNMNGKEAWKQIKALQPDVKAVFISGYAEDIFTKDGIPDGEATFIQKPVPPTILVRTIRELLDAP